MQCDTNHVKILPDDQMLVRVMMEQGYEPLPENLQEAARRKLNGRDSAFVSKTSGGKLSKFAAGKRKAKRKKARKAANRARALRAKRQ